MLPPRRAQDDHTPALFNPTRLHPRFTVDGAEVHTLTSNGQDLHTPLQIDAVVAFADARAAHHSLVVTYADGSQTLHAPGRWPTIRLA